MAEQRVTQGRKVYEAPQVKTEEVLVRSALWCPITANPNPWTDVHKGYCGYFDHS